MFDFNTKIAGRFTEKEVNNTFDYKLTDDPWAIAQGFHHEIDCGHGQFRFGNILKTVAHICVDDADDGSAVVQKWQIKQHRVF